MINKLNKISFSFPVKKKIHWLLIVIPFFLPSSTKTNKQTKKSQEHFKQSILREINFLGRWVEATIHTLRECSCRDANLAFPYNESNPHNQTCQSSLCVLMPNSHLNSQENSDLCFKCKALLMSQLCSGLRHIVCAS